MINFYQNVDILCVQRVLLRVFNKFKFKDLYIAHTYRTLKPTYEANFKLYNIDYVSKTQTNIYRFT